ncbi:hypothetical protein [Mucilaginibacter sp.]|uniref:hypothetical protein n=1 Tax=Mucilaginibacter sp. TaxID=1882438 RepID=UPI003D099613
MILIKDSSREKSEYLHVSGKLIYRDSKLGKMPYRDSGAYRYIKIAGYSQPFEIYADEQGKLIDSLKIGNTVTAWYQKPYIPSQEGVNRFLQFLEKDNKLYFEPTGFQQQLGYAIILMALVMMLLFYVLYKKGKIAY